MAHIIMMNKPYMDKSSVRTLIKYATTDKRTGGCVRFRGAIGADSHDPEEMIRQFIKVKKYYGKTEGRQVRHFVVSFDPTQKEGQVSSEMIAKWAYRIAWFYGSRYQMIYGIHEDTDTPHVHFVFNTVSYIDGKMYTSMLDEISQLYNHIDRIIQNDCGPAESCKSRFI